MKIALTTLGTKGDLQPYIALGLALQKAGHDVLVVSARNEATYVKDYGLRFHSLDVDIQKIMEGKAVRDMSKGSNPLKFVIGHFKGSKALNTLMIKTQGEIYDACRNADLIVYHPGMPIGFFLANEQHKKSVLASPFPIIATRAYPSILFYQFPTLGGLYNLITHFIFDKIFWALAKTPIKTFWQQTMKTQGNFTLSAVKQHLQSGLPVLNAYSQYLFRHPAEWPKNVHTTGSWAITNEVQFTAPEALLNFISNGAQPLYMGFGSMKAFDNASATFHIIAEALAITGQRAILAGFNHADAAASLPDNIFLVESIPHAWLFPQMKLVVHHGGAGTTAAGLMAGRPTIIVPHNADQPSWGKRIFELGVGPRPIKKTALTSQKLAKAIIFAQQPDIVLNAGMLAKKMRTENGVHAAVEIINDLLNEKTND